MIENTLNIIYLFLFLFICSFCLYFPLLGIIKNKKVTLRYVIPVSISTEILVGYLFYLCGKISFFPIAYLVLVILVNLFSIIRLNKNKNREKIKFEFSLKTLSWIVLIIPIIYTRFYYAIKNLAPGNPDTYSHIYFLNDLKKFGVISQTFYAPGYHILVFPASQLLADSVLYRFLGPVMGIFILLAIFLLVKDKFKNIYSKYLFLLLFCVPIFNPLILQTIGFWPSALSFIFFFCFLSLLIKDADLSNTNNLVLYSLFTVALSLTVPYLYVQYLPVLLLFCVGFWLFGHCKEYKKYLIKLFFISIIGLIVAFTHVYLLTQVIHKNGSFPQISFTTEENGALVTKSNYSGISLYTNSSNVILKKIANSELLKNGLMPMINTYQDILRPKGVVPISFKVSIKSYAWLLCSFILAIYFIYKKNRFGFAISFFSVIYGIANMTGLLELGNYRGRSGWYFMFLSIIGIAYLLDYFYKKRFKYVVIALFCALFVWSLSTPPYFYSYFCNDIFPEVSQITKNYPNQELVFYTDNYQIDLISKQITTQKLTNQSFNNFPTNKIVFVVFEKNFCDDLPENLKAALTNDKGAQEAEALKIKNNQIQTNEIEQIKNNVNFSMFEPYWENKNYSIYKIKN